MRTLYSVALLALCLTVFAGCAAENDPVGLNALPTDPGMTMQAVEECCGADGKSDCAADRSCGRECEQEER